MEEVASSGGIFHCDGVVSVSELRLRRGGMSVGWKVTRQKRVFLEDRIQVLMTT